MSIQKIDWKFGWFLLVFELQCNYIISKWLSLQQDDTVTEGKGHCISLSDEVGGKIFCVKTSLPINGLVLK